MNKASSPNLVGPAAPPGSRFDGFGLSADMARTAGGSTDTAFNDHLLNAVLQAGQPILGGRPEASDRYCRFTFDALAAFRPRDEIEGMLAAQALALHNMSMDCARRALIPNQAPDVAHGLRKAAANASRTFVELLGALDRKRGRGSQQKVRVEHVHVHRGGQAIVGSVEQGRGRGPKMPSEPHVPALAALAGVGPGSEPLRGQNPPKDALLRASDDERQVPTAWREEHGASDA